MSPYYQYLIWFDLIWFDSGKHFAQLAANRGGHHGYMIIVFLCSYNWFPSGLLWISLMITMMTKTMSKAAVNVYDWRQRIDGSAELDMGHFFETQPNPNFWHPIQVFTWPNPTHRQHSAVERKLFTNRYVSNKNKILYALCIKQDLRLNVDGMQWAIWQLGIERVQACTR